MERFGARFDVGMIYCDFLTGFLGSGKTTLLNRLLKSSSRGRFAVVVNEFGEVGLDQWVFSQISDNVYLLDSGCLCCTITHSLRETLMEIHHVTRNQGRDDLKKVVIESSGLADPLPTLHALLGDAVLKPHFQLGSVVTTVDAMHAQQQLTLYPESLRQVLVADHLWITKTDLVDTRAVDELQQRLKGLNPSAQVMDAQDEAGIASIFNQTQNASFQFLKAWRLEPGVVQSPKATALTTPRAYSKVAQHSLNTTSWSRFIDVKPTWVGLAAWWEIVKTEYGTRLLRTKGMISIVAPPSHVMIHGVANHFHTPSPIEVWPDSDTRGRLVCIGIGLDSDFLDASLRALSLEASYAKPKTLAELSQLLD